MYNAWESLKTTFSTLQVRRGDLSLMRGLASHVLVLVSHVVLAIFALVTTPRSLPVFSCIVIALELAPFLLRCLSLLTQNPIKSFDVPIRADFMDLAFGLFVRPLIALLSLYAHNAAAVRDYGQCGRVQPIAATQRAARSTLVRPRTSYASRPRLPSAIHHGQTH